MLCDLFADRCDDLLDIQASWSASCRSRLYEMKLSKLAREELLGNLAAELVIIEKIAQVPQVQ